VAFHAPNFEHSSSCQSARAIKNGKITSNSPLKIGNQKIMMNLPKELGCEEDYLFSII
jgi:hypothetical protein